MNSKLFVGNLSFNTTENDLQDLFQSCGSVTEVNLITDRMSGRSKGFAFVTMSSPEEAQNAISTLNGKNVNGRDLNVSEARPREERPERSGGGGGYGGAGGSGGYRGGGGGGGRDGGRRQFSR
jgi:cold-inducible RNA-binding protein